MNPSEPPGSLPPEFLAVVAPDTAEPADGLAGSLAALDPCNPFLAPAYTRAREASGAGRLHWLVVRRGAVVVAGCPAFVRRGRRTVTLEIESMLDLGGESAGPDAREAFWEGLARFCRRERIGVVELNSYASRPGAARLPTLGFELERRARVEHLLDLGRDLDPRLSTHHCRLIRKAVKAGLEVRSSRSIEALRDHLAVMADSARRRIERGDPSAPTPPGDDAFDRLAPLLEAGVAEVFQASRGGVVLSSLLVLLGERGAYYQSAGTSPEGMACGASPWLVVETARALGRRGFERFNLGGANPDEPGLYRFKSEFGGRTVALEAATFDVDPSLSRKLRRFLRAFLDDPRHAHRLLVRAERFAVYTTEPATGAIAASATPATADDLSFAGLTDDELRSLPPEFAEQVERFERLGYNDAFAVIRGGEPVHVAWLVPFEHDRGARRRDVKLEPGEAEITHCLTARAHRGRGYFPYAVAQLCRVAADRGLKRVWMISNVTNAISQRGIARTGFTRCGTVVRLVFPPLPGFAGLVVRTHRWRRLPESPAGRDAPCTTT